jgi:4-hydroxy-4-methyl-2-oxoglutarate aldolase
LKIKKYTKNAQEEQTMTNQEIIEKVRRCRLADLADGLDAIGLVDSTAMSPEMRPIRPGIRFAGFAYTVKLIPAQKPAKVCDTYEEYMEELDKWCSDTYTFNNGITPETAKDMVVVIDMDGYPGGIWGSEIGAGSMVKGISGVVIDGACRDSEECNIEKVDVFCTKRSFRHVYGRLVNGGVNIPISCAGVTVNPGDILCADDDGVLVIPRDKAEKVLEFAIPILEDDQKKRMAHYKNLGYEEDGTLDRMNK